MPRRVRDVMASSLFILRHDQLMTDAARVIRDQAVGSVLITENDKLYGVLTDRDIYVPLA